MSLVAEVEGWDWLDGDVRLEAETVVGTITGLAHAGGESQEAADQLLFGYWVIIVEDRNHNGELDMEDYPWVMDWVWVSVGEQMTQIPPPTHGVVGHAVGWDGNAGNLLPAETVFELERGKKYLLIVVAVGMDSTRSAGVEWPVGEEPDLAELIGLTADGLAGESVSDYEVVGFRQNRIDPPRQV